MSIRAILALVSVVLLALLGGLVLSAAHAARAQAEVSQAERQRFTSWQLADELRQSSDDLTRMARTFVVTADPYYEACFNAILAIRSGTQARPEGYDGIYWDFAVVTRTPPERTGRTAALEELMREMAFTEDEFAKLAEAKRRSDALAGLETVAMNAAKGRFEDAAGAFTVRKEPDLEMARSLMHGAAYHEAKASVMEPIRDFFDLLDARTAQAADEASERASRAARTTLGLAIAATVVLVIALLLLLWRIVTPIRALVDRLREMAEGDGDLTRRIDERRRDEFGELGRWFNRFVGMVHDIVHRVMGTSRAVATAAAEISASAREQERSVSTFGASTSRIAAAVKEISSTGSELAQTMGEVSRVAGESAALAADGRSGLREMESMIRGFVDSAGALTEQLAVLDERAAGINRIVTTIVNVSDRTELLSVNAAIEAEKAGEFGAGFHVVAREIRHLADQTAEATLEIERDVTEIQAAVSAGVRRMGEFGGDVRRVDATVTRLGGQLGSIIEQAQQLSGRFESVTEGMEQQSLGARQIDEAMGPLTASADRATASLAEFTLAADHLRDATASLEQEIGRFRVRPTGGQAAIN